MLKEQAPHSNENDFTAESISKPLRQMERSSLRDLMIDTINDYRLLINSDPQTLFVDYGLQEVNVINAMEKLSKDELADLIANMLQDISDCGNGQSVQVLLLKYDIERIQ